MKVTFVKTGARRYAVTVERERYPDLRCGSIGFDEHVAKMWRKQRIRKTRLPDGRRSEVLAGELYTAWRTRRSDDPRIERLIPKLDEIARRWQRLQVGGSLTLEWPRAERDRHGARRASGATPVRRRARF